MSDMEAESGSSLGGPVASVGDGREDRELAVRNAFKVSGSLLVTWGVALGVRLFLPRHLGPSLFGDYNFAENFAATFFVALTLGIEPYIYREVAVRPRHASDFFGGVLLVRVLVTLVLLPVMTLILRGTARPTTVQVLVWLFSAAQLFITTSNSLAAMLQARSQVDGPALLNVVSKLTWATGIVGAIFTRAPLWIFVLPLVLTEGAKTAGLAGMARRRLGLELRLDLPALRTVLATGLPFFLNTVALAIFARLDVTFLAVAAGSAEVGYYGAANGIGALALLATPLLGTVLFPLLARAAARSDDELNELARRSLEAVFAIATPVALGIALGAQSWIRVLFGRAFDPAATALAIVAPSLLITYVNIFCTYTLNVLRRTWTATLVTVAGIAVDSAFNLTLLRPLIRWLDRPGAGGIACALALLVSELVVSGLLVALVGHRVLEKRNLGRMARTVVVAAATLAVDLVARPLGPVRLLVDAAAYAALALALGAIDPTEMGRFARMALRRDRPTG